MTAHSNDQLPAPTDGLTGRLQDVFRTRPSGLMIRKRGEAHAGSQLYAQAQNDSILLGFAISNIILRHLGREPNRQSSFVSHSYGLFQLCTSCISEEKEAYCALSTQTISGA